MTIRLQVCTRYGEAPDEVWAVIERIEQHDRWMVEAKRIVFVGRQRRGVGTEFECDTRFGPLRTTDVMRVTEWEPPFVLGIEHEGAVVGRGRFVLTAEGDGTRVCWEEELRFPWWLGGWVGERIARQALARTWRRNLDRLRALL